MDKFKSRAVRALTGNHMRMIGSFVLGVVAQALCGANEQCVSAANALIGMCLA